METLNELLQQGKDPAKLIEDMIFYFRDMLLYQTAPDLEGVLEKVKVDEEFQALSRQIPAPDLYEMIDILNKSHQEMKWTNHPRIFFEVAVVKLCQGPKAGASAAAQPEVDNLVNKVRQLEQEIEKLKTQGVQVSSAPAQPKETSRPQKA